MLFETSDATTSINCRIVREIIHSCKMIVFKNYTNRIQEDFHIFVTHCIFTFPGQSHDYYPGVSAAASAPFTSGSPMVNFDSEELDQYFPDNRQRALQHHQTFLSSAEHSQPEYTTLHSNYGNNYTYEPSYMQSDNSGYYGDLTSTENSWNTVPASWMKQY